jgi:hypothetical protein
MEKERDSHLSFPDIGIYRRPMTLSVIWYTVNQPTPTPTYTLVITTHSILVLRARVLCDQDSLQGEICSWREFSGRTATATGRFTGLSTLYQPDDKIESVLRHLHPRMTALARPRSNCTSKLMTHPLVRQKNSSGHGLLMRGRNQDKTCRLTVGPNLTSI